jgi:hypothetical protein
MVGHMSAGHVGITLLIIAGKNGAGDGGTFPPGAAAVPRV